MSRFESRLSVVMSAADLHPAMEGGCEHTSSLGDQDLDSEMKKDDDASRWWTETLGSPQMAVAPMVDASELAWRLLSRSRGAQLCYTPMLHASVFARDAKYRRDNLQTTPEDRPLIAQFCGNDPETLLAAARLAAPLVDGVDINLGCPQAIARRGRYGAFLQDEWPLLADIVRRLREGLSVPVTCKIRVFTCVEHTVAYARMLVAAGAHALTVHGRTREQKGPLTGTASWAHIRAVRKAVDVPVIANGNIQCLADVHRCLEDTGASAVMAAEGNLYNPSLFRGENPPAWVEALEYLDLVEQHPCPASFVRGHLFKLFHHCLSLPESANERQTLATGAGVEDFRRAVLALRDRYLPFHEGTSVWTGSENSGYDLSLPPWLCQSYVRPPPEQHLLKMERLAQQQDGGKRAADGEESRSSCKRRLRRLRKTAHRVGRPSQPRNLDKCSQCPNPLGGKCGYRLCKACCRSRCYQEDLDCPGHGILVKTRRQVARARALAEATV